MGIGGGGACSVRVAMDRLCMQVAVSTEESKRFTNALKISYRYIGMALKVRGDVHHSNGD